MGSFLFAWPYFGLTLAGLLLAWLAFERRPAGASPRLRDPAWVLPLLWPMYLVHQFEEHGIDLLGRHYSFLAGLCRTLGYETVAVCPADPAFIFSVNVVGVQVACAMAWIFRRRNPLIAACAWGVALMNGLVHVGPAIAMQKYNPGVLTSLLLFLPLSALMLRTVLRAGLIAPRQVLRIIGSGIAIHALLLISLKMRGQDLLSPAALLVLNAVNGLWPLPFGLIGVKRKA